MTRRISIFDAMGGIGQNTIDHICRDLDAYKVVALSCGQNVQQLTKDAVVLCTEIAVTCYDDCLEELRFHLAGTGIEVAAGASFT